MKSLFGKSGLSPLVRAEILALLILFAGFFSAVLLALTSFARSFKEAQAYLIPVMLLSLAPGFISLMPGVEFDGLLAVTPLLNIVLLARDLFEGSVDPTLATAAVLTTALYALAAIGLAARVFGTDAILYGSEASWSDLFRRSPRAMPVPSVSGAMFCLALLFPGCFLVRGLLAQSPTIRCRAGWLFNGVSTVVLFAGFPLVAAIVQTAAAAGHVSPARGPAPGLRRGDPVGPEPVADGSRDLPAERSHRTQGVERGAARLRREAVGRLA